MQSFSEFHPVVDWQHLISVYRYHMASEAQDVDHRRVRGPAEVQITGTCVDVDNESVIRIVFANLGVVEFWAAGARQIDPSITDPVATSEMALSVLLKIGMVREGRTVKHVGIVQVRFFGPTIRPGNESSC